MSYPEIPVADRPYWSICLKVWTYFVGRWTLGTDPTYCKTWRVSDTIVRFGFEDAFDFTFHDCVLDLEVISESEIKVTVIEHSTFAGSDTDIYWNDVLMMDHARSHVGESFNVEYTPPIPFSETLGFQAKQTAPEEAGGYWIVNYWVRKVRGRFDKTLADDHNIPKAVLKKIKDVEAQKT